MGPDRLLAGWGKPSDVANCPCFIGADPITRTLDHDPDQLLPIYRYFCRNNDGCFTGVLACGAGFHSPLYLDGARFCSGWPWPFVDGIHLAV